ncbi:hypothetical protein LUZ60_002172 [Juncus effusus]|nr:hypothetical protein LUZ60_002172 [Juncus effusus]
MASRIILARMSRSAGGAVNRLVSARPEPWLSSSQPASWSLIKAPLNSISSRSFLTNGAFQKLGFSSTPQPNQPQENENAKSPSEKEQPKPDESQDSDKEMELSNEELIKLVTEKEELLEQANKEVEKMKDMVLRSYAERENVIERTRREAENSKKFAIQSFAKSLLDVADNLERASSVVKESFAKIDSTNEADKAVPLLKTLLDGVEMTNKQLYDVFRKFGVEKYDASNETFDPHRHNAVFQVPDPSKPAGTVAVVLKNGYMLHDRVLRPAEVGVTTSPDENSD